MHKRASRVACAVLSFGVVGIADAQPPPVEDELEQFKQSLARTIEENITNAEARDMNGFHVQTADNAELGRDFRPNGNRFQQLHITSPGVFRTIVEKGRPGSLGGSTGVFHRDSGERMFSAWDADGDGRLDGVEYSVLDENGKIRFTVIDYEADGELDLRLYSDHAEIWNVDRWYRIEKRGAQRGVMLNGEFVELERQGNRPVVPQR